MSRWIGLWIHSVSVPQLSLCLGPAIGSSGGCSGEISVGRSNDLLLTTVFGGFVIHLLFKETFPPNIYYKIFIQRPIQDICANAPRDYTAMGQRRPAARHVHNKGQHELRPGQPACLSVHFLHIVQNCYFSDKSSWYQRWENNGWRLVSDRVRHVLALSFCKAYEVLLFKLLHKAMLDPVTFETSRRRIEFKHTKVCLH